MDQTTKALKLAEEALLDCIEKFHAMQSTIILGVLPIQAARASQALTVIREARAETVKQEPVAKYQGMGGEYAYHILKLYEDIPEGALLYAAPVSAKREWVELTDDEIMKIWYIDGGDTMASIAHTIIAAFKEKNT